MERFKKNLKYLLILLPLILVFKNLFNITNPLVWGDAPYFYPENLKELFNMPFAWEIRNNNFGSPQLLTLWLFMPTFLMGLLHFLFGLNHEISIRLVFYLPYLIFGGLGTWLLLSKYKFSDTAKIFGIILYLLNTYSITLFDGGQIGILLSYGLFPSCFYFFLSLVEKSSLKNFSLSLIMHFLIFNTDLRIAIILILFETIWAALILTRKNIKQFLSAILIYVSVFALSGFWIIPFFYGLNSETTSSSATENNFINLTNSFYLFQPHFPENDFGNLNRTPIYFIFLSFILFLGLLKKDKLSIKLGTLFLFFAFLSKGSNPPYGDLHNFITGLPLGNAFRDSSKFYIPLLVVASFMAANSVDYLKSYLKNNKTLWIGSIYLLLLITIFPALSSQLTGALGVHPNKTEFNEIKNQIHKTGNFRSLWFNEKPSMGFAGWNHPPVSANSLVNERPFASMTDSDYDLFGFLHDKNISEWYELLGIKNIFYPPYEREKSLSQQEKSERKVFENFISQVPGLVKLNLPLSFPAYETQNPLPKIFAQEKIIITLGGDEIYEELFQNPKFALEDNSLLFPESCKFDPQIILNLNPETFNLLPTEEKIDLYLSFFCNNFIPATESKVKEWAINDTSKYLNWKSQLLERGINNKDYDFNKGLAYSTKENEKLEYELKIPKTQSYFLPIRFLTATESAGLKVNVLNEEKILKSKNPHKLQWELVGPLNLNEGSIAVNLTNTGGLIAFNTLGLIPEEEFIQKTTEVDKKLENITTLDINTLPETTISFPEFTIINPSEYEVKLATSSNWLIFSERFNKDWILESGEKEIEPLPFYSMINGYYIKGLNPNQTLKIYYKPQDRVKKGLTLTTIGLLALGFAIIVYIIRKYGSLKKLLPNPKH